MKSDKKTLFAERIRKVRGAKTQQAVADLIGIQKNTWWRWESGLSEPDLSQLVLVAQTFSISVDWLLGVSLENEQSTSPNHIEVLHKAEAIINCAEEMKSALADKIDALKGCL